MRLSASAALLRLARAHDGRIPPEAYLHLALTMQARLTFESLYVAALLILLTPLHCTAPQPVIVQGLLLCACHHACPGLHVLLPPQAVRSAGCSGALLLVGCLPNDNPCCLLWHRRTRR